MYVCMYVCILHLLRTNMSCKWDGKSFICTNRRCGDMDAHSTFASPVAWGGAQGGPAPPAKILAPPCSETGNFKKCLYNSSGFLNPSPSPNPPHEWYSREKFGICTPPSGRELRTKGKNSLLLPTEAGDEDAMLAAAPPGFLRVKI